MDIQGGELMALKGATKLLSTQAIDLIYSEVLFADLYENQGYFHDISQYLREYGYFLYGLYNMNYGKSKNGVLAWADAIFICPRIEESLGYWQAGTMD
jgi:hypothetical protein